MYSYLTIRINRRQDSLSKCKKSEARRPRTSEKLKHTILQPLQEGIQYKTADINAIYYYHFTPDALM
ncbi:MAG: hypothetical protein EBX98_00410, partial [Burkholderiaceae bacterium]|nr:hypothetical protein [Burkholderiaceae bacterium]